MKKAFFILVLSIIFTGTSFAQVKLGLTAGLNISTLSMSEKNEVDWGYLAGFQGGLLIDCGITNNFSIIPELLISQRGAFLWVEEVDNSDNYIKNYFTINYLQVPLNLTYKIKLGKSAKFLLFAGPYVGYALSASTETEISYNGLKESEKEKVEIGPDEDQLKALDYGVNIGTGVQFGKIFLKVQYNLGLNNLNNYDVPTTKNVNVGLTLGYYF